MNDFDEAVLNRVIPKVQAWEMLNNLDYVGQLNMVGYYNLMIKAGYSEKDAQESANIRGWERLKVGLPQ